MIPGGLLSSAILSLVVVAEPAALPQPLGTTSFERAAQPGSVLVDTQLLAVPTRPVGTTAAWGARERAAALPLATGGAPDASRAVASWVSGNAGAWRPRLDLLAAVKRIELGPGPAMQLAVLIPLFLVLLARKRRFDRRVHALALPAHRAASRTLIRVGH